ncbi:MAG: thioredoxin family protein, partial [Thermoguttaceae bacterium]|nr:thioredoxin family protein [Thermoguttaceae bacterium]
MANIIKRFPPFHFNSEKFRRIISGLLPEIIVLLLLMSSARLFAQPMPLFQSGGAGGGLPGSLSGGLTDSNLPAGMISFEAQIVPASVQPSENTVPRVIGYLLIQQEMQANWHIYSPTQQSGGQPTRIEITSITGQEENLSITVGDFQLASKIHYIEFFGNTLEELKDRIDWVAPIYCSDQKFSESNPDISDTLNTLLSSLKISGTFNALACSEGESGSCVPVNYPFSAVLDPEGSADPILEKISSLANQKAVRPSPLKIQPGFLLSTLFKAFLGGLILNIMPCVLPVIGLKIVSFFEQAGHSRALAFYLNVWYTGGILSVFLILALMSVGLSHFFTYGLFQVIMSVIVFAMALNLMGVWEIQLPAFLGGSKSNELMQKEGATGAYFKGIITTLLAIPCGAPLLSPVLVWTDAMIRQNQTVLVLIVYLAIGLGMSTPYLLIGAFPELLRFLPKPGLWMETFRNVMGYVLLIAVIWLLYSMPLPLILPVILFLFAVWFACWFLGRAAFSTSSKTRWNARNISWIVLLVTFIAAFEIPIGSAQKNADSQSQDPPPSPPKVLNPYTLQHAMESKLIRWAVRADREGILKSKHWQLFERSVLDKSLAEGTPVIIDFTADWCMNCKAIEFFLYSSEVLTLLEQKDVVSLVADWTNNSGDSPDVRDINALLDKYGGRQVPTIMVFRPDQPNSPIIFHGFSPITDLVPTLKNL